MYFLKQFQVHSKCEHKVQNTQAPAIASGTTGERTMARDPKPVTLVGVHSAGLTNV